VGSVNGSGGNSMVAFDTSGNVKWTVPGYSPKMATADGDVCHPIAHETAVTKMSRKSRKTTAIRQ
jgi:hypothetical protein